MFSTAIYVDREFDQKGVEADFEDITHKVHAIKPHFGKDQITEALGFLHSQGLLASVSD